MPSFRGDTRSLDLLAGGDLRFLQRLAARDLELLDRPLPFEPGEVEDLLAHDVGASDLLRGDDIGFLHPTIGVGALGELGRDLDRALLLGDFQDFPALDVEDIARLRRLDSLLLQSKLDRDARGLDGLAPPDLGVLDRLLARDVARSRLLLGGDALGGEPLLLRDAVYFDRFARRDLGRVDGAIAGDLQRAHFFVARYFLRGDLAIFQNSHRLDGLTRRDLGRLDRFVAGNFQPARFLLGADAVGGDFLVERDARNLGRTRGR